MLRGPEINESPSTAHFCIKISGQIRSVESLSSEELIKVAHFILCKKINQDLPEISSGETLHYAAYGQIKSVLLQNRHTIARYKEITPSIKQMSKDIQDQLEEELLRPIQNCTVEAAMRERMAFLRDSDIEIEGCDSFKNEVYKKLKEKICSLKKHGFFCSQFAANIDQLVSDMIIIKASEKYKADTFKVYLEQAIKMIEWCLPKKNRHTEITQTGSESFFNSFAYTLMLATNMMVQYYLSAGKLEPYDLTLAWHYLNKSNYHLKLFSKMIKDALLVKSFKFIENENKFMEILLDYYQGNSVDLNDLTLCVREMRSFSPHISSIFQKFCMSALRDKNLALSFYNQYYIYLTNSVVDQNINKLQNKAKQAQSIGQIAVILKNLKRQICEQNITLVKELFAEKLLDEPVVRDEKLIFRMSNFGLPLRCIRNLLNQKQEISFSIEDESIVITASHRIKLRDLKSIEAKLSSEAALIQQKKEHKDETEKRNVVYEPSLKPSIPTQANDNILTDTTTDLPPLEDLTISSKTRSVKKNQSPEKETEEKSEHSRTQRNTSPQIKQQTASELGFNIAGNPVMTPIYFSKAHRNRGNASIFVYWKDVPGLEETQASIFKSLLDPAGNVIVPQRGKEGFKIMVNPERLEDDWQYCLLRLKAKGKRAGSLRIMAQGAAKSINPSTMHPRFAFSLGKLTHK